MAKAQRIKPECGLMVEIFLPIGSVAQTEELAKLLGDGPSEDLNDKLKKLQKLRVKAKQLTGKEPEVLRAIEVLSAASKRSREGSGVKGHWPRINFVIQFDYAESMAR